MVIEIDFKLNKDVIELFNANKNKLNDDIKYILNKMTRDNDIVKDAILKIPTSQYLQPMNILGLYFSIESVDAENIVLCLDRVER